MIQKIALQVLTAPAWLIKSNSAMSCGGDVGDITQNMSSNEAKMHP